VTHPILDRMRKPVDWAAKAKALVNPRFVIVAAGWATIPADLVGVIEGYFTVYAVDTWEQTHCCEINPSYCLEECDNVVLFADEVDEEVRDRVQQEWCYGGDDCSTYVHCSVLERGGFGVVIGTLDNDPADDPDPEYPDDPAEQRKAIEAVVEHCRCNAYL